MQHQDRAEQLSRQDRTSTQGRRALSGEIRTNKLHTQSIIDLTLSLSECAELVQIPGDSSPVTKKAAGMTPG